MACFEIIYLVLYIGIISEVDCTLDLCDGHADICTSAISTPLFEDYSRSKNCKFNSSHNLCDRYLNQKWYRSDEDILLYCPEFRECGAEYPLWLNGTLPDESEGSVTRTVCKRGIGSDGCCVKTYDIKIKNCSDFMAYCLTPAEGCYERYCFGENKTCIAPPKIQSTTMLEVPQTTSSNGQLLSHERDDSKMILLVVITLQINSCFLQL